MDRICLFCLFVFSIFAEPSIVFVHLGNSLPDHLPFTIAQARKFNPNCPIYLIANEAALRQQHEAIGAEPVSCESLHLSEPHKYFFTHSRLDKGSANGLWFFSTERFFYLEELMRTRGLTDVIHMENDVLLYVDLNSMLPAFQKCYAGMIGATFEQDLRCVPGFMYISHHEPLSQLLEFINSRSSSDETDMRLIGLYKKMYKNVWIDHLPTIIPEYIQDHQPLTTILGIDTEDPILYANHFEEFNSIFDAACFGIFIGGDDPKYHEMSGPGRVHPMSVVHMSDCQIDWQLDEEGRKTPLLIYKDKRVKINNLHMTNKKMLPSLVAVENKNLRIL